MQKFLSLPQVKWLHPADIVPQENTAQKEDTQQKGAPQNVAEAQPVFKNYEKGAVVFALVLYAFIVLKDAWLGDDAFITLRTVYNFLHGYGLTWNTDERVQTYTHPLWMLMLSAVTFVIRVPYVAALILSISVSCLAVVLLAFWLAKSPLLAIAGILCLTASKAFVDYSTSGLENPMTHLLIVVFVYVFYNYQQHKHYVLWLSLLGMLMVFNRMDTLLLFTPALLYVLWQYRSWKTLRIAALAFVPFILWELFSLFYYGSLVPNTAYAKLNLGVSTLSLIKQGVGYFISSFAFDPILLVIMLLAICLVIALKDWKSIPLVCGMLLYMAYVVKVGGDFMAGRFLTPPFLIAVILLMRNIRPNFNLSLAFLFAIVIFFGVTTPYARWSTDPVVVYGSGTVWKYDARFMDERGITDERYFYASTVNLLRLTRDRHFPDYKWAAMGWQARVSGQRVIVYPAIGILGYEAGPNVHIVDTYALGDPLLSHLPVNSSWKMGQFTRDLPAGYVDTIKTGQNEIKDPNLAQYYDKVRLITRGPLFSWERLVEILKFNTGGYNYLLQLYLHRHAAHNPVAVPPTHVASTPTPQIRKKHP